MGCSVRILIISHNFPPKNAIGAVRVGKLAKYLHDRAHEVRVVTAPPVGDTSLPLEIPADQVFQADDRNIDRTLDPLIQGLRACFKKRHVGGASGASEAGVSAGGRGDSRLETVIKRHYYALLQFPDARAGWRKNAIAVGRSVIEDWRPDLIYASSPPVTGLFVAAALGKQFGIPWVAEFRDLWKDNPYYEFPAWRRVVDGVLERRLLQRAALLVTVTPLWAQTLEKDYGKRVAVILNGG